MKKTLVAQSIAALIGGLGLVGASQAVVTGPGDGSLIGNVPQAQYLIRNTDGIGHKLMVPYFSVQNGNDTYINLVNTDTRNGKAVKVRFRGASNSDDVFDFTLLMSPGDVFAAAITKGADGLPTLVTLDKSCTLPQGINGQKFVTTRLNPALTAAEKATEASEGYVEVFNMADIPPTASQSASAAPTLYNSIKHSAAGTPRDCNSDAVNDLGDDPADYAEAQALGLEVPTTGLMGNWTIINVPTAASWTGDATALQAQTQTCQYCTPGYGNIVFSPQKATAVSAADAKLWTADPLLRGGTTNNTAATVTLGAPVISAAQFDFPDMSTPYLPIYLGDLTDGVAAKRQAYILSRTIAHSAVMNEYITDVGVAARTDWVFSMPTRRYNVARDYKPTTNPTTTGTTLYTDLSRDDAGVAITTNGGVGQGYDQAANFFTPKSAGGNTTTVGSQICVEGIATAGGAVGFGTASVFPSNINSAQTANREENFASLPSDFVISPGEPEAPLTFCGEVSVLSFNVGTATSLLGAQVARKDLTVAYTDGWVRMSTPGLSIQTGIPRNMGLPTLGFAAMRFTNGAIAAGTSGNYGLTFPHRTSRTNLLTPLN